MKHFSTILFATSVLFTFSANASDNNNFSYLGISIQNSSYDDIAFSPDIEAAEFLPDVYTKSMSDTGERVFVGYHFNKYFAVETGITSHGEPDYLVYREVTDLDDAITKETIQRGNFKTFSGDVRLIGTYSISDKMFFKAQLGSLFWDNEFDYISGNINELAKETKNETGISLLTGFGLGYGFSKNFAISIDFENTKIAEINTQTVAISMMYRL